MACEWLFTVVLFSTKVNARRYISSPQEHEVRIHFRTIKENKPHPKAKSSLIRLPLPPDDIVGNALDSATLFLHSDVFCLQINYGAMLRVILWNWMSGTMLYVGIMKVSSRLLVTNIYLLRIHILIPPIPLCLCLPATSV